MLKKALLLILPGFLFWTGGMFGQETKGQFSGSFDANVNFFVEDEEIGATNTPQYDDNLIGIESWLNLRYQKGTFDAGIRLDFFNNSNLYNPMDAYSDFGIGRIYVSKQWDQLEVTAGHFYDQIGSGIIYKSYEERALLLDNPMLGLRLRYDVNDTWNVMVFGGKQKYYGPEEENSVFQKVFYPHWDSWIGGGRIEGYLTAKNEDATWSLAPGGGVVVRHLTEDQMDALANILSSYTPDDFIDKAPYTTFAASLYNTLAVGAFSWYVEGAYKSKEVFYDLYADRTLWNGEMSEGKYVLEPGYVVYNSLSYAKKGFGAVLDLKATRNFVNKADPTEPKFNQGFVGYLPPMTRVNTYRLPARYAAATQDLGELAGQLELTYRESAERSYLLNYSHITDYDGDLLYREILGEATFKKPRKRTWIAGLQMLWYDQERYQGKTGAPTVKAITPYVDVLYKIKKKQSIRVEAQYMHTEQDFGSWVFALVEVGLAPHWIFELSDMWNVSPTKGHDALHYPTFGVTYSTGPHRFSARYVKQVEGIVCSGGICRLEPAFSGVKLQVSSQF